MRQALVAMLVWLVAACPVLAQQGPQDTVAWVYASLTGLGADRDKGLAYLSAPERRAQYFSARMVAFYAADDTYAALGQMGCIDFGFEVSGQDFDAAEISNTLTLSSQDVKGRRVVTASFSNFGQLTRVAYEFVDEGGFWRIDDIAGPGWRVSEIPCKARGVAETERQQRAAKAGEAAGGPAYTAGAAQFCYRTPGDVLRMDVGVDGVAAFELKSVQPAGHSCTVAGNAVWTGDGWVYAETLVGGPCRMEILVTADQGLRLTDADRSCKASLCGPSAVLDGLRFARASQIDCAYLPAK